MKTILVSLLIGLAGLTACAQSQKVTVTVENESPVPSAQPRRVALVVQNHTSDVAALPMAAFADTLAAKLSCGTIRIINPQNAIGVNQNRMARGEVMPDASALSLARQLGAEGLLIASIQEFTSEDIGVPPVAHLLKVRLSLSLADAATGETICGVTDLKTSRNYGIISTTLYGGHDHEHEGHHSQDSRVQSSSRRGA